MLGLEWAPIAGALVGLIVGLTGVGGGALMAPILLVGFGLNLSTVVATDLLFATLTKLAVTRVHHKNQFISPSYHGRTLQKSGGVLGAQVSWGVFRQHCSLFGLHTLKPYLPHPTGSFNCLGSSSYYLPSR